MIFSRYIDVFHCLLSSCSKNLFHSLRRNQRDVSLFPSLFLNFFRLPFTLPSEFLPLATDARIFAIFLQAPPIPFTNKLHHRFPFRFPLPPPYLPLYFHPPYTPSIFTTSADRWSVNRTPFHPTSRHIPPSFPFRFNFRRAPLLQTFPAIIRVHFVVPSVTRLYARTSKLFPVFISIALFRIVLPSFFLSFPLYVRISPPPSPSPLPSPYLLPFIVDPW